MKNSIAVVRLASIIDAARLPKVSRRVAPAMTMVAKAPTAAASVGLNQPA